MQKATGFLYNKQIKNLAKKGESLFKDLPHLPKNWVTNIVKILPYLVLIGGILTLISQLQSLFAYNRSQMWAIQWMQINRTHYYVMAGFGILSAVLYLIAYKPLKNKKYEGWLLLFWVTILSILQSLVLLFMGWGNLISSIIAAIIGAYLLYEIRSEFIAKETKKTK
jgi:hypothetical protein